MEPFIFFLIYLVTFLQIFSFYYLWCPGKHLASNDGRFGSVLISWCVILHSFAFFCFGDDSPPLPLPLAFAPLLLLPSRFLFLGELFLGGGESPESSESFELSSSNFERGIFKFYALVAAQRESKRQGHYQFVFNLIFKFIKKLKNQIFSFWLISKNANLFTPRQPPFPFLCHS